nr:unnamed protein product [Callosobruchus chinensis]
MFFSAAPPNCKSVGSGKYPGETCNQYYECTKTMWWYNVKSKICPDGQIFDSVTRTCLDGSCNRTEPVATTQPTKEETKENVPGSTNTLASTEDNTGVISTLTMPAETTTPPETTTAAPTTTDAATTYFTKEETTVIRTSTEANDPDSTTTYEEPTYSSASIEGNTNVTSTPTTPSKTTATTPSAADGQIFDASTKNCLDGSCSETGTTATAQPTQEETTVSKTSTNANDPDNTTTFKESTYSSASTEDNTGVTSTLITTTKPTTASPSIDVLPPDCESVGPGKYPSETCNQYYECIKTMWWYNVKSQVCPDGQIFDLTTKNCLAGSCTETEATTTRQPIKEETTVTETSTETNPDTTITSKAPTYTSTSTEENTGVTSTSTTPAITTTAVAPIVDFPPICKLVGPGKHPAASCQHYYKCLRILWWYVTKLKKCPHGKVFSPSSRSCIVGTCDSSPTSTETTTTTSMQSTTSSSERSTVQSETKPNLTTSKETSSTASAATAQLTTTSRPISPPICQSAGPGNYPADNCRQYYQCTKTLWWYNSTLKTCPDGQIFDSSSNKCVVGSCN